MNMVPAKMVVEEMINKYNLSFFADFYLFFADIPCFFVDELCYSCCVVSFC